MARKKTKPTLSPADIEHLAVLNVDQFCLLYGVSRPTFYRLLARGEGPKCMMPSGRRQISAEEARAWRKRQTAKETQRVKAAQREREHESRTQRKRATKAQAATEQTSA